MEIKKPLKARKCIASWEKYCPDYQIQRWDETNTDFQQNALLLRLYEEKRWALLSDIVRLLVVYEMGGIYLDTDVEILKPLVDCILIS